MEENEDNIEEAVPLSNIPTDGAFSSSGSKRGSLRGPFLERVKQNDVDGVRALAREHRLEDSSACDELGRTALIVAIDESNYDMIKCLLELQHDAGDALYHAVSVQNAAAVKVLCKNLSESCKSHVINGFPCGRHYPAVMTPLLLAGKNNNFEIIEVLLHHGAKLPDLNDLVYRAESDPYLKFLALVNWYEAASSEAYILLTSDDPLDTIFKLGQSLQEAEETLKVPLFNVECERIENKLADLSVKLLSLARDNGEIGVLLRGGEEGSADPRVPLRIKQAMEIHSFKKFVCHPSSQAYMMHLWDIPRPHCLAKHSWFFYSYLFNIMVVLLYPILCVAYILLPWKTAHFMKRP
ncbi:transient receptor potential-gamma protein-like [Patiria miniata]|uniref:Transient receptor ion channel domain-containing protein n=1 Tax=Patiria miniata TaxID=46514 RepID=A0A914BN45_PATMI|nr:transient receptor potential-gamma protein-like [Patiria miniata]